MSKQSQTPPEQKVPFDLAKAIAAADGYVIVHAYGKTWQDNSYTLQKVEPEVDGSTTWVVCHKCGTKFPARTRDIKAGHGRYCTRRCAGASKGKSNSLAGKETSLAPCLEGVQVALL
jgi:hypothetical protein